MVLEYAEQTYDIIVTIRCHNMWIILHMGEELNSVEKTAFQVGVMLFHYKYNYTHTHTYYE